MKKLILSIASAITALALTSCFQHEMTITLNKDGSGTLVEESRMGAAMLAMISQFSALGGEDAEAEDPLADFLSEEKAKERAKAIGEGVTLVKIEPVDAGGSKGARVTFAFQDINKLNVDIGSGMNAMGDDDEEEETVESPMGFAYKDGKLTVKMPWPEEGADGEAADEDPEMPGAQEMAMMQQMFADMKMSIKLVIEPGIAETNATHRDGNTITIMEMDFGKLAANPENFKKLAATGNMNEPAAAIEALKDIDGVKLEVQRELTVTVK